jgi:hypothetical protein
MANSTDKSRKPARKTPSTVGRYVDPERSGRYTRPVERNTDESPRWFGAAIVGVFILGLLIIILNYLDVLPDSVSQWYLLTGILIIFAGFAAMMKLR